MCAKGPKPLGSKVKVVERFVNLDLHSQLVKISPQLWIERKGAEKARQGFRRLRSHWGWRAVTVQRCLCDYSKAVRLVVLPQVCPLIT